MAYQQWQLDNCIHDAVLCEPGFRRVCSFWSIYTLLLIHSQAPVHIVMGVDTDKSSMSVLYHSSLGWVSPTYTSIECTH